MPIQLLKDEEIINESNFMDDTLILTNKRLIYQNKNNPNTDSFIGFKQITSANAIITPVTYYKLSDSVAKTIYRSGGVILGLIISGIISYYVNHVNSLDNFTGTFLVTGLFTIGGSMLILYILVNIFQRVTATSENKVQFMIKSNDGKYFINRLYKNSLNTEINSLQNQINEVVFESKE